MTTTFILFLITIHWAFMLGANIAMRSEISTPKFLMIMFIIWTLLKNIM
jgi:hypothetical protein